MDRRFFDQQQRAKVVTNSIQAGLGTVAEGFLFDRRAKELLRGEAQKLDLVSLQFESAVMPLIELIPVGSLSACSISENGTFSFPQAIWQRLGWEVPCKIAVTYISQPLTVLLRRAGNGQPGFSLSYQNRQITSRSGVKITCSCFASYVLRTQVVLPLRGVIPAFPQSSPYQLALMLQQPIWVTEDFSQAGLKRISTEVKGVYQLLEASGSVVRIGEGAISSRLREHLKDIRFAAQVKAVQYFVLSDKEETAVMEKILIAQHEAEFGNLPLFNVLHA